MRKPVFYYTDEFIQNFESNVHNHMLWSYILEHFGHVSIKYAISYVGIYPTKWNELELNATFVHNYIG